MNKCPQVIANRGRLLYYAVIATIYLGVAEREEETSANFRIAGRFTELA
jgi:hypothetical protein